MVNLLVPCPWGEAGAYFCQLEGMRTSASVTLLGRNAAGFFGFGFFFGDGERLRCVRGALSTPAGCGAGDGAREPSSSSLGVPGGVGRKDTCVATSSDAG